MKHLALLIMALCLFPAGASATKPSEKAARPTKAAAPAKTPADPAPRATTQEAPVDPKTRPLPREKDTGPVPTPATPDKPFPTYFALEIYGLTAGCTGDWCEGNSPFAGGGAGLITRTGKHWGWGLQVFYDRFSNDDMDTVHWYDISMAARGYLPLGPLDLYAGFGVGYLTYFMDNNKGTTYDWVNFRATAPNLSAEVGVDVKVTKNLKIGLFGRFIYPLWSESCLSYTDGRECVEPQDDSVKLDLTFWTAGLRVSWVFPY